MGHLLTSLVLLLTTANFAPPPLVSGKPCKGDCANCPQQCLPPGYLATTPKSTPQKRDPLRVNTQQSHMMVMYTADWCGACQQQKPMLSQLRRAGYPITSINVDAPKWAGMLRRLPYAVLPHYVMAVDGRAWQVRRGTVSAPTIRGWFAKAGFVPPQRLSRAPLRASTVRRVNSPPSSFGRGRSGSGALLVAPSVPYPRCSNPGCVMCYGRRW